MNVVTVVVVELNFPPRMWFFLYMEKLQTLLAERKQGFLF